MTSRRSPKVALLIVALAASVAASLAPTMAPTAAAAAPSLTLTSDTRYDVDPENQRVHVTVALTAVNHLKDTKTRLYYFESAFLAVQPGATGFKITARTGSPKVRVVSAKADRTLLRIDFGGRLPAGSSRTFTLTFDIPDPGGAPTRETRIGASLVTFGAWAFASDSTPGGSVTVVFPSDYTVEVQPGDLGKATIDDTGRTIFTSGPLSQPLSFFAYFIAERPNEFAETTRVVSVDGRPLDVSVRAWPDDPAWGERIGNLLERGLPSLSELIGLPWVAERPLVVAEAVSRSNAGFSGRYDPTAGRIEIAYYADSFVVLHEAAHAWFDGSLLADRWANESFASWYALQAAAAIEEPVTGEPLTPELVAAKIPLNAWGAVGSNEATAEDYGYAASAELARLIAERAGTVGLARVWNAARQGIGAYQPPGASSSPAVSGAAAGPGVGMPADGGRNSPIATEVGAGPPDWRGLLDLLEERTAKNYDDLWRSWVVRPGEASLLVARSAARRQYEELVTRAGDWQLPSIVRQAMRAWQFEQATELMDAASSSLDDRDSVTSAAANAGLSVPRALEAAFEGNGGFAAAAGEADAELMAIDAYVQARNSRLADPGIVEQAGLWWAAPDVDLARAADAFASGDLHGSVGASAAARIAWESADELGRSRLTTILGATLAALVCVGLLASWIRGLRTRRSARRARRAMARPAARKES
jgi:hypothetical protein